MKAKSSWGSREAVGQVQDSRSTRVGPRKPDVRSGWADGQIAASRFSAVLRSGHRSLRAADRAQRRSYSPRRATRRRASAAHAVVAVDDETNSPVLRFVLTARLPCCTDGERRGAAYSRARRIIDEPSSTTYLGHGRSQVDTTAVWMARRCRRDDDGNGAGRHSRSQRLPAVGAGRLPFTSGVQRGRELERTETVKRSSELTVAG